MSIIDRLRFKLAAHPYHYNEKTGWSIHFRGYSIFTDQVSVRLCRFGAVEDHDRFGREEYLRRCVRIAADNASIKDDLIVKQRAEIDRLKPYEVELQRIAQDVGEPNDPFAAWERIAAKTTAAPVLALSGKEGHT